MYFIHLIILLQVFHAISSSDEQNLQDRLAENYSAKIRPVHDPNDVVPVLFDFILETVNSLDVKAQQLDVRAFVTLIWNDHRLVWNESTYGGINETLLDADSVWRPDLILHNSANLDSDRFEYATNTKLNVESNGNVTWVLYTNWKCSCATDVTWWPADRQKCIMKFGSSYYDGRSLSFIRSKSLHRLDHNWSKIKKRRNQFKVDSGEWSTRKISSREGKSIRPCGARRPCIFPTVDMEIELDRLPLYYMLYIIIPGCALIVTFLLIFHLDIGGRSGYGVGILLSISMYLMIIAEHLPLKSDVTPLLGAVFVLLYFLMCLALPIAEFTGNLAQNQSNRPPPAWCLKIVTFSIWNVLPWRASTVEGEAATAADHASSGKSKMLKYAIKQPMKIPTPNDLPSAGDEGGAIESNTCEQGDGYEVEWRMVGRYLDNVFTFIFLFLSVTLPVMMAYFIRKKIA